MATKQAVVAVAVKDTEWAQEVIAAVTRGVEDGTLDCVVRGRRDNEGRLAAECPAIVSRPQQMCAACRIRVAVGVPRRPDAEARGEAL